ncbi:MAG: ABC transporter substrate-binding protein [Oscillospiraceae bacterium]
MKNKLRYIALLCAISICFTSCNKDNKEVIANAPSSEPSADDTIKSDTPLILAYSEQGGLNPYLTQNNITLQLCDLLYEKMIQIAPDMTLQMRAVSDVRINGLNVTIYPDTSYTYKDGTNVSAEDIAACINAARTNVLYKAQLANIDKIEIAQGNVNITLLAPDSLFAYLLCLPVIKASDIASGTPMSSGRYSFDENLLRRNEATKSATPILPETIKLKSVDSFDEIINALSVGEVSLYATEQENNSSSTTTSLQSFYKMNNLVFIGLNSKRGENSILSYPDGRKAINAMLDRQLIADKCYYSRAYPATGAINSLYPCVSSQQLLMPNADIASADALITSLGFDKNSLDGYYNKKKKRLELELLVYSNSTYKRYTANLIKEHLGQNGIYVNIIETDNFDIYTQKIAAGEFDMYIGEIKMYNNMDLVPFLQGGAVSSGISMSEELIAAYSAFKENSTNAPAFEQIFAREMPYIPLLWRCGSLVTTKNVHGIIPCITDVFFNMDALECTDAKTQDTMNIK